MTVRLVLPRGRGEDVLCLFDRGDSVAVRLVLPRGRGVDVLGRFDRGGSVAVRLVLRRGASESERPGLVRWDSRRVRPLRCLFTVIGGRDGADVEITPRPRLLSGRKGPRSQFVVTGPRLPS